MTTLPRLREELAIYPGPTSIDGAPVWSLHDPVRNLFFRIDWLSFEVLSRWQLGDPDRILAAIESETTIEPEEGDLVEVVNFLVRNELVQRHSPAGSAWYRAEARKRQISAGLWLLHHYLFFRVPLWRPDAWLGRWSAWVAPLFTRSFAVLSLLALLTGLVQVSRQWDGFTASLVDTLSWKGLAAYLTTLVFVKFLHELGHAFTAKRMGCRVPTMGVAFLVMFPMAYTDVNEVWKLPERRKRLEVGAAGILTELTVAAWATLAWTLLPDGTLRTAAFLLATTTWVSTVIINASPFLRFDGYFLLMDWLGMPNLHQRSFALACWRLREALFGLGESRPEQLPATRHRVLLLFAYITWVYRLVVFSGIAVLVYISVPKPLGPVLAAIEVAWFIVLPIWREIRQWRDRLPRILRSPRSLLTMGLLLLGLGAVFLPWDQRVHSQGLLQPSRHYPLVVPGSARIIAVPVANGEAVAEGQVLIELEAAELGFRREAADARAGRLQWQADAAGVDPRLREQQGVILAARSKLSAELAGISEEQARYTPTAPFAGRLYLVSPDLRPGAWVGKNQAIGVVTDTAHWQVDTYLPESELGRIEVGDGGNFHSETPDVAVLRLRVARIDRDATRVLTDAMLASLHGGLLPARASGQQLIPENALYRVTLELSSGFAPQLPQILRGQVVLFGKPRAVAHDFLRAAAGLFVREAGF